MNVGDSIRHSIDSWEAGELDAAMMHAGLAIAGTSNTSAVPSTITGDNARFTWLLRQNYSILGTMGMPGIDVENTRFPVHGGQIPKPKAAGGKPDLADIVYAVYRCSHAHGEALPGGFEMIPDAHVQGVTNLEIVNGAVRLSDRMIFGLLAVPVLAPVNAGQVVPDGYHLTLGTDVLEISEWWGRAADFPALAAKYPMPTVLMDFGDWMS